jgi:hypothetical protein
VTSDENSRDDGDNSFASFVPRKFQPSTGTFGGKFRETLTSGLTKSAASVPAHFEPCQCVSADFKGSQSGLF